MAKKRSGGLAHERLRANVAESYAHGREIDPSSIAHKGDRKKVRKELRRLDRATKKGK